MKFKKFLAIYIVFILVFVFSACAVSGNSGSDTPATQAAENGSVRGIVTSITDSQIEIALMTGGGRQEGNPPSGSQPGRRPDGQQGAQPSASVRPQPSLDLSNAQRASYVIDKDTKIVKITMNPQDKTSGTSAPRQANLTEEAAGISDIAAGAMVVILPRGSVLSTADKITVQGGGGFGQPVSPQTSNSTSPNGSNAQ